MTKITPLLTVFVCLCLMLGTVSPAIASNTQQTSSVEIIYQNKTGKDIRIHLVGPVDLWRTVPSGRSKADLPMGRYEYSYWDCGEEQTGIFVLKKKGTVLKFETCKNTTAAGNPNEVEIFIQNKSGATVRIHLTGTKDLWLNIATGKNKITLPKGIYQYSYVDCATEQSGTFRVKKKGNTLKLDKCKASTGNNATGDIQVFYQNKTGGVVRINLVGPNTVWLTLPAGKTKGELPAGTYQYSYQNCGETVEGRFIVKKKGNTLKLTKCKTEKNDGKTVKVVINNQTWGTLTIYLTGPENYTFYLGTGKTNIDVSSGKYQYTVYGCGTSLAGIKNFRGGKSQWQFWCQ